MKSTLRLQVYVEICQKIQFRLFSISPYSHETNSDLYSLYKKQNSIQLTYSAFD